MLNEKKIHDKYGNFNVIQKSQTIEPIVSVIMSAYNTSEKFLTKSIESVLEQTFENFEFIIINDGANKSTSDILNIYAQQDDRIQLIIQNNMGITKSLNRGIMLARGKYIARQDTDDLWTKNKLKKQIEVIVKNKDIVLIGTQCQILNDEFKDISNTMLGYQERLNIKNTEEIRRALVKFNPFWHASILIEKNILLQVGCYNDAYIYSQDYDLWVRVLKQYGAMIIPEPLTKKTFHDGSITGGSKRRKQRQFAIKIRLKAVQYFGTPFKEKAKLWMRYVAVYMIPESLIVLIKKQ